MSDQDSLGDETVTVELCGVGRCELTQLTWRQSARALNRPIISLTNKTVKISIDTYRVHLTYRIHRQKISARGVRSVIQAALRYVMYFRFVDYVVCP